MYGMEKTKHINLSPTQVLVLGFASVIIIGAFLLNLPIASTSRSSIGFINALFESTSAVCVTGLIVVDTGTQLTLFGQVVVITLIQIGGLGFMTMATMILLLMGKRITLRERLIMQEALNSFSLEGLVRLTKNILLVTFLIEAAGAFLLSLRFIPLYGFYNGIYYSIFHSISAFCNAGFDLIGGYRSLTIFKNDVIINFTIMSLIVLGGLGFTVILDIYKNRNFRRFSLHTKLAILLSGILIAGGTMFFFVVEYGNSATLGPLKPLEKLLTALFQSVTSRTAGFNTIDIARLTDASKFMTIILMFIGASPASTGGGIKTSTASIILMMAASVIRGREDVEVFHRRIPHSTANRALTISLISLTVLLGVTMVLSLLENVLFIDTMFEVASALGTVGLATIDNGQLKDISKIFIIFTMFAGRLGPLTLTMAFARRQSRNRNGIRYPEGKVMVG